MTAESDHLGSQHHQAISRRGRADGRVASILRRASCMRSVGENGAGKSTLMKILSGVITDYDGELLLRGKPVRFSGTRDAERGRRQHHSPGAEPGRAAFGGGQHLSRPREPRHGLGCSTSGRWTARPAELLKELECDDRSAAARRQPARRRSAADRDRQGAVAAGRHPDHGRADQRTDRSGGRAAVSRDRAAASTRGVTILYISHKMDEVFRLADRITVLRDGRLVKTLDRTATDSAARSRT